MAFQTYGLVGPRAMSDRVRFEEHCVISNYTENKTTGEEGAKITFLKWKSNFIIQDGYCLRPHEFKNKPTFAKLHRVFYF